MRSPTRGLSVSAYLPTTTGALLALGLLVAILFIGFAITRVVALSLARILAWILVAVSVVLTERLTADEPAGIRMIAIILALLYAMKSVVTVESRADLPRRLRPVEWAAFAVGWFGMRARVFLTLGGPPRDGARHLIWYGLQRLVIGVALVVLARFVWPTGSIIVATVLACIGLSLFLHFGVFNIVAGVWRTLGADTGPSASRSAREASPSSGGVGGTSRFLR